MERAYRFGREEHLAGIISTANHDISTDVAVVIPNAGFIHHVGPWQLHLDLVRRLDDLGLPSLRFDLSGLGDSVVPRLRESPGARTQGDIRDAIDLLVRQTGARRIILAGLCSGAVESHRAALADERVCGAALLDAPAFPDRLYPVIYWAQRALSPGRVFRFLRRKLGESTGVTDPGGPEAEPYRPFTTEAFVAQLETATHRGVEYLFTYSRDSEYNHRGQLYSILTPDTPRERIAVYYFPKLAHTPVLAEDRRVIADTLAKWIGEKFL